MRIRNFIKNFKWISDNFWSCYKYNIDNGVTIFWLKPECVIEKVKLLKVKLIKDKAYRSCIWIKRIQTDENYAETIIAMVENFSKSSTAKLKTK